MARGLITVDQINQSSDIQSKVKYGCLLDTNILISASLPIDPANDRVEELLKVLKKLKVPVYSNVNIRAEFLEIQRRVLIPECLIELYESQSDLGEIVEQKLKSVQTSYRKSLENKKVYKFTDDRIKEFRDLLSNVTVGSKNGWSYFCENYLAPQLSEAWDEVVKLCGLNFIKIRDGENHPLLISKVSWKGVTDLMGTHGIGSADAMITNLLLCSKIEVVASGDGDIKYLSGFLDQSGKMVLQV